MLLSAFKTLMASLTSSLRSLVGRESSQKYSS